MGSFHNSSTEFLRLHGVLILVSCPIVMSRYRSISHCFKVLRECWTFMVFHH